MPIYSKNSDNVINVKNYGALGDGSTDDTAAIQAAITAAAGSVCYLPDGNYVCGRLYFNNNDTTLAGPGTLESSETVGMSITAGVSNIKLKDFTLDGNSNMRVGVWILENASGCSITDVTIKDLSSSGATHDAILFKEGCHNLNIRGCIIDGVRATDTSATRGIRGAAVSEKDSPIHGVRIIGNHISNITPHNDAEGIVIQEWSAICDVVIANNTFENCAKRAIKLQAPGCVVTGNVGRLPATDGTNLPRCAIDILTSNVVVANNRFELPDGADDGGILIGAAGTPSNIVISGNHIYAPDRHGAVNMDGVDCDSDGGVGIVITGNYFGDELRFGVRLQHAITDSSITGNHFNGCNNYTMWFPVGTEVSVVGNSYRNCVYNGAINSVTGARQDFGGRTIGWGTTAPGHGTFLSGSRIYNLAPSSGTTTDLGWVCTDSGTMGTLTNVSGSTTNGSPTVEVNDASDLEIGHYLDIDGNERRILDISGTTITVSDNMSSDDGSVPIDYFNATWEPFGNIGD